MAQIPTTNLDAGTDSPANARADLLACVQRVNGLEIDANGSGADLVAGTIRTVSTIAALRAVASTGRNRVMVAGYYAPGDGGGGLYWLDTSDTTTADNGGTVIVSSAGGRWKLAGQRVVTPRQFGARADGVANDAAALSAAISVATASGQPLDLQGLAYATTTGLVFAGEVLAGGAKLKFVANVDAAVELRPRANVVGQLTIDVSAVNCTTGLLLSGAHQSSHATAQRGDFINVIGQNHTASTCGVRMDATVAGAGNKAWIHYCDIKRITVENFGVGAGFYADQSALTLSYVNGNAIGLTLVGCRQPIVMSAQTNADVDSNFLRDFVIQYGWVAGSGPTRAIQLSGRCSNNWIEGALYDWDHVASPGPVITLDQITRDNTIETSVFGWEIQDLGNRNRFRSTAGPLISGVWAGSNGRNYIGDQDNVLGSWAPSVGTLTGAATTSGTAAVSLSAGAITDVQKENSAFATLSFVAGTGQASYAFEYSSTTIVLNNVSVVGAFFERGYHPQAMAVYIKTGATWDLKADFSDISGNDVFARLDSVSNSDIYNGVTGIRVVIKGSDTRQVRVRQIFASGTGPGHFASRGGDRMNGDLQFRAGIGPVLTDTSTGNEYRLRVTGGAIALEANPAKIMTHF